MKLLVILLALAWTSVAHAQPASTAAAVDPPQVAEEYARAFALLLTEDWEAAADRFRDVAARSVEPERRASAAEFARFGREMAARTADNPTRSPGRPSFVVSTTVASFYSGFVLVDLLAIDDYKKQAAFETAVTFAGFGAALLGSRGRRITDSMASAYGSGLLIGLGNGLLFGPRLGIEVDGEPGDGDINQEYLGFSLATMALGGAGGMYLADRFDPTPAQAQFGALIGLNGLATVGLGLVIIDPDFEDDNTIPALLGVGLDLGVLAGTGFGHGLTWSKTRLTYVTLGQYLGLLAGGALGVISVDRESDSADEAIATFALVGLWSGFGLSAYLTRDLPADPRYRQVAPTTAVVPIAGERGMRGVALTGSF